ncbi:MAG: hypothetical protein O3B47_02120 [bacterium]|nr:hypothetical protein [bacterium]
MDSSVNRPKSNPEKDYHKPGDRPEHVDSKELREAANVGRGAYAETVGLDESAETVGRVSEVLTDAKEQDKGGSTASTSGTAQFDPAQIKKDLLKVLPREKAMRTQIEREIKKEIDYLHKKAIRMLRKPGEVNYFEMSNIMSKIRELRGILLRLAKAATDSLKTLWLRYVHGVM